MEKMKTVKVSADIHKSVKKYIADIDGQTMSDFADWALIQALIFFKDKNKKFSKKRTS